MAFDENMKKILKMCRFCFMCRHACPVFLATKIDANTPRGHALLISKIDENMLDWSEDIIDKVYQCSLCSLCKELCEFHWEEDTLIQKARETIVAIGRAPDYVKKIASLLINQGTAFSELQKELSIHGINKERNHTEVLYFAGNTALCYYPEIIEITGMLLNSMGISWCMLDREESTGIELSELGYSTEAIVAAKNLAEKISKINPEIIITGNPHAYKAFKDLYPRWGIKKLYNIKIYHIAEYLNTKILEGKLKLKQNLNLSGISYHDPCQLGRNMGIFDAPRELIKTISGNSPIELFHNRSEAECCGAGSVMHLTNPDIALKTARKRIENALEENSKIIVTACHNCKRILAESSKNLNAGIKVLDMVELISFNGSDKISTIKKGKN
jgi:heterodisulfide reductase subunit D